MSYVIEARGTQSYGVRVVNPSTMEVLTFETREEANAYAALILPEMPSKNLPLVVVEAESMATITIEEANAEVRASIAERDA